MRSRAHWTLPFHFTVSLHSLYLSVTLSLSLASFSPYFILLMTNSLAVSLNVRCGTAAQFVTKTQQIVWMFLFVLNSDCISMQSHAKSYRVYIVALQIMQFNDQMQCTIVPYAIAISLIYVDAGFFFCVFFGTFSLLFKFFFVCVCFYKISLFFFFCQQFGSRCPKFIRKCLLCRRCIEQCHMAGTIVPHLNREFQNLKWTYKWRFDHLLKLWIVFLCCCLSFSFCIKKFDNEKKTYRIHLPWPWLLQRGPENPSPNRLWNVILV